MNADTRFADAKEIALPAEHGETESGKVQILGCRPRAEECPLAAQLRPKVQISEAERFAASVLPVIRRPGPPPSTASGAASLLTARGGNWHGSTDRNVRRGAEAASWAATPQHIALRRGVRVQLGFAPEQESKEEADQDDCKGTATDHGLRVLADGLADARFEPLQPVFQIFGETLALTQHVLRGLFNPVGGPGNTAAARAPHAVGQICHCLSKRPQFSCNMVSRLHRRFSRTLDRRHAAAI